MPQPVKELGEVEVKIGQKSVHANHISQCHAKISPVFLNPAFERGFLEIAQAETEGLIGLQIFMRHRADRRQSEFLCKIDVGGAAEMFGNCLSQDLHDFFMPGPGVATAQAEVEENERVVGRY